jgi:hypothetical protein
MLETRRLAGVPGGVRRVNRRPVRPPGQAKGPDCLRVPVIARPVRFWTDGRLANRHCVWHGDAHDYMTAHTREAGQVEHRLAALLVYEPPYPARSSFWTERSGLDQSGAYTDQVAPALTEFRKTSRICLGWSHWGLSASRTKCPRLGAEAVPADGSPWGH